MNTERDGKLSFPLVGNEREYRDSEWRDKLLLTMAVAVIVGAITLVILLIVVSDVFFDFY